MKEKITQIKIELADFEIKELEEKLENDPLLYNKEIEAAIYCIIKDYIVGIL
jgi:hypothetical protein